MLAHCSQRILLLTFSSFLGSSASAGHAREATAPLFGTSQAAFPIGVKYRISQCLRQNFHATLQHHLSFTHSSHLGLLCWFDIGGSPVGQTRSVPFGRHCYHYYSRSGDNCSGSSVDVCRYRGFFFFLGRILRHYEHINADVLKTLKDIHLENVPKNSEFNRNICDNYRFVVIRPTDSYLYPAAILHLKQQRLEVGKNLEELPEKLKEYNAIVDSTETYIWAKLNQALRDGGLAYDEIDQAFFNILRILARVWNSHFIKHLDEPFGRFQSTSRILEDLDTLPYEKEGPNLYLAKLMVGKEHEVGDKEKVLQVIKNFAIDPIILEKLELLECSSLVSKRMLAIIISEIAEEASNLSKAIAADAYTVKVDCCYALVPWLIRYLVR